MWEVIDVHNNSEVVGTYPTKALNASRRVEPRQARTIRCRPTAGASAQDNADQATKGDGPASRAIRRGGRSETCNPPPGGA